LWETEKNVDIFLPQELSLVIELDLVKYPNLILLNKLFNDVFNSKSDAITLHYYPSKTGNPFNGYCFETVCWDNPKLGFGPAFQDYHGLGAHVHWLKMFCDSEITNFFGPKFFTGAGIRLARLEGNTYSMEYTGF
jgi:hypothetical protein